MSSEARSRLARRLLVLTLGIYAVVLVIAIALCIQYWELTHSKLTLVQVLLTLPINVAVPVLGYLVVTRRPSGEHVLGFAMLAIQLAFNLNLAGDVYASLSYQVLSNPLPLAQQVIVVPRSLWDPAHYLIAILAVLVPTGRPPSRAWWVVVFGLAAMAVVHAVALLIGDTPYLPALGKWTEVAKTFLVFDSIGSEVDWVHNAVRSAQLWALGVPILALLARLRGPKGVARRQVVVLLAGTVIWWLLLKNVNSSCQTLGFETNPEKASFVCVPMLAVIGSLCFWGAVAVAVFRFRMWTVDVVLNKTLVYTALGAWIGAVYVASVAGLGAILAGGDRPSLALSVLATAVVAAGFQPVRERAQRAANRLIYGQRWSPYEVMRELSRRLDAVAGIDEVLERIAESAARGVGGRRARVRLLRSESERSVQWPPGAEAENPELAIPIVHQGELLAELWVEKEPGESVSPSDTKFLSDLAAQAALALQNVRLSEELEERLVEISRQAEDLRESRRRIVAAQDVERRKIERDLHDGAQQRLVTLAIELNLARKQLGTQAGSRTRELLGHAYEEVQGALAELRDLAGGIHPAVLTESGLSVALGALARRATIPVTVDAPAERFPPEVEAAAYFLVSEALVNVAKHAEATAAAIEVHSSEDTLTVTIRDDGRGGADAARGSGLTGLADRVAAAGGRLKIESPAGGGTVVAAEVPIVQPVSAR